jgi:hypothetical protein
MDAMHLQRIPKTWRIVALITVAVTLMYLVASFLIMPRFEAWLLGKLPEAAAVKTALEKQFPDKTIGFSDNTSYGSGSQGKQRVLVMSVSGKRYLGPGELATARDTICDSLGPDLEPYDGVALHNVQEKRFLMFYSTQSLTETISCKPE